MWTLCNVVLNGRIETIEAVIDAKCLHLVVKLIESPATAAALEEPLLVFISHISSAEERFRDMALELGIMPPLLSRMQRLEGSQDISTHEAMINRRGGAALTALCKGKIPPNFDLIRPALPVFNELLKQQDVEVISSACSALFNFVNVNFDQTDRVQDLIEAGIPKRLVELLNHEESSIVLPALQICGIMTKGDATTVQLDILLNCGLLRVLPHLLAHPRKDIREEACWTVSNVTAGTVGMIQQVIESGALPGLIKLVDQAQDVKMKREAAEAVSVLL